jgi:hypothetical protein
MPKAYEAMRDKFAGGAAKDSPKYDRAQAKAAAIYNAKHKDAPVTGRHRRKRSGMKGAHVLKAMRGGKAC